MSEHTVQISDENFPAEIEQHKGLALVDFSAIWCPPCQRLAPVIDELAQEFKGKVKIAKLDVDSAPATTANFGIQSIPALLLFKDGKKIDQKVGAASKESLKIWINGQVA